MSRGPLTGGRPLMGDFVLGIPGRARIISVINRLTASARCGAHLECLWKGWVYQMVCTFEARIFPSRLMTGTRDKRPSRLRCDPAYLERCAGNLAHGVNDLNCERGFLEHVVRVVKERFQIHIGSGRRQTILFDEVDDFSQADRGNDDLTPGCGGPIDEVAGRDGQMRIIVEYQGRYAYPRHSATI